MPDPSRGVTPTGRAATGDRAPGPDRPTLLDRLHQRALRVAYLALRGWWAVARPRTRGAFVGVWCGERVLILKNSYVAYQSFPGGGVRAGEAPAEAAARECAEEVGLTVTADALTLDFVMEQTWEGKRDTVWMYRLALPAEPPIRIDHREVVEAAFVDPREALRNPLFGPVRRHLEASAPTRLRDTRP